MFWRKYGLTFCYLGLEDVFLHDTTIQWMTIRRMLIERHFWLHCWLSDFIKEAFSLWLNHKISQTKKAKLGYIENAWSV